MDVLINLLVAAGMIAAFFLGEERFRRKSKNKLKCMHHTPEESFITTGRGDMIGSPQYAWCRRCNNEWIF